MRLGFMKKLLMTIGIMLPLSVAYVAPLKAADSSSSYLAMLVQMVANIVQADNTKNSPTPLLQSYFAGLGNQYLLNMNMQNNPTLLLQLISTAVNQPVSSFGSNNPSILSILPSINNMTYSSLLGLPPVPKAPVSAINYIASAGGLTVQHLTPGLNWQGNTADQIKYNNYYNTMISIESFNGYILNYLLADNANGNKMTPLQDSLIGQATSSSWIATIASESIGQVLRQLLMFESQSYVLMTQLVNTMRQQLTAQVMTNTLLIESNQNSETLLVAKAQGVQPTP